jgi:hypothetical protein
MPALIVPLLAQLITVGVSDRTEVRYIEPYPYKYEGSTKPAIRLNLAWPRYALTFGYSPSFTLGPLEARPRDLTVYHSAFFGSSYRFRHTVIALGGAGSYGEVNFLAQALRQPAAPGQTVDNTTGPATGDSTQGTGKPAEPTTTPQTPEAQPQRSIANSGVRYGTWNASLNVGHQLNRDITLGAVVVHTVAGGLNDQARGIYPVTRGTIFGINGAHLLRWSPRDSFGSAASLQQGFSSLGGGVTSLLANETWTHRFAARTTSTLGGGISMTRTPLYGIYMAYSIYPTFAAGFAHETRLAQGILSIGVGVYSAPALDPLRATVDPRIGTTGTIGWVRDRFAARASAGVASSIAPRGNDAGAFDSAQAGAVLSYRLAEWLVADSGGTLTRQKYQDTVTVPLTYAAFVGLSFDVTKRLNGGKP